MRDDPLWGWLLMFLFRLVAIAALILFTIILSEKAQAKPDAEECRKAREDGFILYDCVDHSIVQVTNIVIFPEVNVRPYHMRHKLHQGREAKHVVRHAKRIVKL